MAKLDITLSKDAFEALDESLKDFYTPNKDGGYELEGIGSLSRAVEAEKKQAAEKIEKAKQAAVAEALKQFEGLDVEAAKQALAAQQQAQEAKLKDEGNFEELRKQYEAREQANLAKKQAELEAVLNEKNSMLSTLKRERLSNVLTEKGVLPDRVRYLVHELDDQIELITGDNGFELKKRNGIGDATEFDLMIDEVKTKSPFFFAADNASGGGASGSNGGGWKTAKTWTRSQWDSATNAERTAFSQADGQVTD